MDSQVVSALISSIIGGIVVAFVNHLLTMRKTNAEIRQIELNNEKTRLEIQQLRTDLQEVHKRLVSTLELGSKRISMVEETRTLPEGFDDDERTKKSNRG